MPSVCRGELSLDAMPTEVVLAVRACMRQSTKRKLAVVGQLTLTVDVDARGRVVRLDPDVDAEGHVVRTDVDAGELTLPEFFVGCVATVVRAHTFSVPDGGLATVQLPFTLNAPIGAQPAHPPR